MSKDKRPRFQPRENTGAPKELSIDAKALCAAFFANGEKSALSIDNRERMTAKAFHAMKELVAAGVVKKVMHAKTTQYIGSEKSANIGYAYFTLPLYERSEFPLLKESRR